MKYLIVTLAILISMTANNKALAASALGDHKTAVLLVNYSDHQTEDWTIAFGQQVLSTLNNFYREMSYENSSFTGEVYGWFTVSSSSTSCDVVGITAEAKNLAAAAGVNLSLYNHFIIMTPGNMGCGFTGVPVSAADVKDVFVNGPFNNQLDAAVHTIAHEYGHAFSLGHSDALDCGSEVLSLNESSCIINGYGDQSDNMGNRRSHWNASQKERVGFLNTANTPPITTVTASGEYFIDAYETKTTLPKALKIFRVSDAQGFKTHFYVEYRQLIGFDSNLSTTNFTNGVTIRLGSDSPYVSSRVQLLDMTPNSGSTSAADVKDGALLVGRSFTDPKTGITISLISADSTGARVQVTLGAPPPPPPPPVDTTAPSVSITSPVNGAIIAASSTLTISATASDNVGVSKVEFRVNGSLKCTDSAAPYSCAYAVPKGGGKVYNIEAQAYDAANNSSVHSVSVSTASKSGSGRR